MSTATENQQVTPINSMELAYETFLHCRFPGSATELYLDLLIRTFDQLRLNDSLIIELPDSWLQSIGSYTKKEIKIDPTDDGVRVSSLPPKGQQLLSLIELGAKELQRLWSLDAIIAVRSLGYTLHPIPNFVRSSEMFNAKLFLFSFRVAAFCWTELSQEAQQALCDIVGAHRDKVEKMHNKEGFSIDIFGYSRKH
ncbi:hypothetical protein VT98_10454 [Candidatus Electrothrix communis]|uniref:Uncharacterized protein n=1 Tax=Candidatus Electrothrix communis TaxID=1859133 RepID=A0A444J8R1_9BACT|nr:hypothetical protein VT98_10454 [Candidatus Electrothrix communis]WLE98998.1 MAG: hypothetical protein QTN59_09200 [Candidatus Electrothrix communis]